MTIVLRDVKGSPLTFIEMDGNITHLLSEPKLVPKDANNTGILIDSYGTPVYGWHDLKGHLDVDLNDADGAPFAEFINGVKAHQFTANMHDAYTNFHLPHDYLMGSNMFIHVHWAHTSATITGGSVTWGLEVSYAKGHSQGASSVFHATKLVTVAQVAGAQYEHMVAETALSVSGGSLNQLDTDILEPDGLILCRIYLDSNDLTDSVAAPDPFALQVDVHYQSTNVATKNKSPDFWT